MVFKLLVKYVLLIFAGSLLLCCSDMENPNRTIVAEVGEGKLFLDEVSNVLPDGIDDNDSILMADDYIKRWIKQELLIQKAEENLTPEQKNVTKELLEYRNSLIIYKYKNELIKQRMDTTITEVQINNYYQLNTENFSLNKNIVKAIFVKIPGEFANPDQLKSYCNKPSEEELSELREYCLQYAKRFDIFIDKWVDFEIVIKNIPQKIDNPGTFLTRNNLIEMNDSNYYYLVSIQDYKLKNDTAPVEYVNINIKNLILNRRKIDFLKQIEDNIYTEGIRKNKFKINKQKTNETN